MKESQNKKYQNVSIMALSSNNTHEVTKKNIQSQEIFFIQPYIQSNNRKFIFKLPLQIDISACITIITDKFSSSLIHAAETDNGGEIIIQGLQYPGFRRKIAKIFDYFVFCCSRGLRFGRLQETYNIILITVKKQVIDSQTLLTITNPYNQLKNTGMTQLFIRKIVQPIRNELLSIMKQGQTHEFGINYINPYLSQNSPTQIDIIIHKKLYSLFVFQNKQFTRYRNLLMFSRQKILKQIQKFKQKNIVDSKNKKKNPSGLIQIVVKQAQNLLTTIKNTVKQQDHQDFNYLKVLVSSESNIQVSQYTIQQIFCYYEISIIRQIYLNHLNQKCLSFNKNIQFLNKNLNDQQCFKHLSLKDKYRLPNQKAPYQPSINRLKSIKNTISLRQSLLIIQQVFSDVKTDCYISHNGKIQLNSMDELLPVLIFVTLRAAVPNFPIIINMIQDYVRIKKSNDSILCCSGRYLCRMVDKIIKKDKVMITIQIVVFILYMIQTILSLAQQIAKTRVSPTAIIEGRAQTYLSQQIQNHQQEIIEAEGQRQAFVARYNNTECPYQKERQQILYDYSNIKSDLDIQTAWIKLDDVDQRQTNEALKQYRQHKY